MVTPQVAGIRRPDCARITAYTEITVETTVSLTIRPELIRWLIPSR
jgi:hypothetical protein